MKEEESKTREDAPDIEPFARVAAAALSGTDDQLLQALRMSWGHHGRKRTLKAEKEKMKAALKAREGM